MGMHNSRKLQLEQATLMAWGFMVLIAVKNEFALDQGLSLKPNFLKS
jgi:hypothetical protein